MKNVALLILWAYENGYELTGGELFRTKEQQSVYVKEGKSHTYQSKHLERLAIDVNLFLDGKYQTSTEEYQALGKYWKSLHPLNRWGGDFRNLKDGNHFEMT
jgi:hypothetical protein